MKEQGFEGRYEWDPPITIPPETAVVMVHLKREGATAGSSGYVEYAVRNGNDIVCFVYFGWYAPLSGATMVGCGWLDSGKTMTYDDQYKVRYQQYNNQRVYSQQHGLVVSIAVMDSRSSPEIQVIIEDVRNRLLESIRAGPIDAIDADRLYTTTRPDSESLWFISHDKVTKVQAIRSGGFGLVHLASWADTKVVVRRSQPSRCAGFRGTRYMATPYPPERCAILRRKPSH